MVVTTSESEQRADGSRPTWTAPGHRGGGPAHREHDAIRSAALRRALRVAAIYVATAAVWIAATDLLLDALPLRSIGPASLQTLKGWGFVVTTGVLLFLIVRRDHHTRMSARESARRTQEVLQTYISSAPFAIVGLDLAGRVMLWNTTAERMFGWSEDEVLGGTLPTVPPHGAAELDANLDTVRRGQAITSMDVPRIRKDGRPIDVSIWAAPLREESGAVTGAIVAYSDRTDLTRAQREIRRQIERLEALRAIDQAINGSLDLDLTLNVLLDQVIGRLGVSAAAVLLTEPGSSRLTLAASRGLAEEERRGRMPGFGQGLAGRAVIERRVLSLADRDTSRGAAPDPLVPPGDWASYWVAPLVAKGEVLGVLEAVSAEPIAPTPDWVGFLEALAGQAALAVSHAGLFEEIRHTNVRLRIAYDATLEGWSRTLDLRDEETEGHSQRVTEMTVRLARALGLDGDDLVNIRRGALLHDIGKMGVPDRILRKPGPLTAEEWEVMKRHPDYAFQLLSPIEFLRPALDIPYCHHERWNGTGYPRGLAGDRIPVAARIFAVVDVWDALRSDRPYRAAWTDDRIREHIAAGAGILFDPAVVAAFLSLDWHERSPSSPRD